MGKPGAKPISSKDKSRRGNPGKKKLNVGILDLEISYPKPSMFLSDKDLAYFKKTCDEMSTLEILHTSDGDMITQAALHHGIIEQANLELMLENGKRALMVEALAKEDSAPSFDFDNTAPVIPETEKKYKNPLLVIIKDHTPLLLRILNDLGLSPTARERLPIATKADAEFEAIKKLLNQSAIVSPKDQVPKPANIVKTTKKKKSVKKKVAASKKVVKK